MTKIGYARVSTPEQNLDAQLDILKAAGAEKVYVEKASGVLSKRPQLDAALDYLRKGDTLIITKLDRLGRSVKNLKDISDRLVEQGVQLHAVTQGIDTNTPGGRLFFHMIAAIAEFEHDLIVERTMEGLAAARARGRKGGRRRKMTEAKIKQARIMYDSKEYTLKQIADTFGIGRTTLYRYLDAEAAPKEKAS